MHTVSIFTKKLEMQILTVKGLNNNNNSDGRILPQSYLPSSSISQSDKNVNEELQVSSIDQISELKFCRYFTKDYNDPELTHLKITPTPVDC